MTTLDQARPLVPEQIRSCGVIAIGRRLDPATVPPIAEALVSGGIRAFEVTMNSLGALEAIAALRHEFGAIDLVVGAGTVLDIDMARRAVDAGAMFLVMPNTDPKIIAWSSERHIPSFPGGFTPSEILTAWRAGAAAVKVFPASAVGPVFVREMRGPLPQIPLVPTGGVTLENAPAFIAAGALAVGMGSWLTGSGDAGVIRDRAAQLVEALSSIRGNKEV
jgi:2-dehydro-3-deoxyphosphogluconate aldolase / (4S)-4-hydroxy-2-oxoglutarate aldolase